jgi:hypothetical protein
MTEGPVSGARVGHRLAFELEASWPPSAASDLDFGRWDPNDFAVAPDDDRYARGLVNFQGFPDRTPCGVANAFRATRHNAGFFLAS